MTSSNITAANITTINTDWETLAAAKRKRPENLNAYDYYLLGSEKIEKLTKADEEAAITFLNRAVGLDPGLARAWVELYHAHVLLGVFGVDPESNFKTAADVAEHAVQLDPSDAEAHAVFGMSLADRGDIARAKVELDTALRLAPGSSEILNWVMTAGAMEKTPVAWSNYLPLYRTPAGTGVGAGFLIWQPIR